MTRNLVLTLPGAASVPALPAEALAALAAVLGDLGRDARSKAAKSWRANKGPMATYAKSVSALARATRRAVQPLAPGPARKHAPEEHPPERAGHDDQVGVMRSARRETRNPVLGYPSVQLLQELPPETRRALGGVLQRIAMEARGEARRAFRMWRFGDPDAAALWKAVSVYAGHMRRAMNTPVSRGPGKG